jgi:hypothetical protein
MFIDRYLDFFVVEEKGQALLGKQTALDLGILQIHVPKETVNVLNNHSHKSFYHLFYR